MNRISIRGMLIGGLVDVVTSTIFAFVYASWVIAKLGLSGAPHDQVAKALVRTPIYLGYLTVGFGCSVWGGYIAARIAKHDELLNGMLSSFLCISLGIFAFTSQTDSHPLVIKVLLEIASPAFALIGGYLALLRRRASTPRELTG